MSGHKPVFFAWPFELAGTTRFRYTARCSCRWANHLVRDTRDEALADHAEHVTAFEVITVPAYPVGDQLRLDGDADVTWTVRAHAAGGRYLICTAFKDGAVHYTICDRLEMVRGPLNVLGGGMGIDTLTGRDEGIDDTVRRLEQRPSTFDANPEDPDEWDTASWGISHRNRLHLAVLEDIPQTRTASRPGRKARL